MCIHDNKERGNRYIFLLRYVSMIIYILIGYMHIQNKKLFFGSLKQLLYIPSRLV